MEQEAVVEEVEAEEEIAAPKHVAFALEQDSGAEEVEVEEDFAPKLVAVPILIDDGRDINHRDIEEQWSSNVSKFKNNNNSRPKKLARGRTLDSSMAFKLPKERSTLKHLDLSPMSVNSDDLKDPRAKDILQRKRCCQCCRGDTFPARLCSRLKLDHTLLENSPFFYLLKALLVIVIALAIDKGTQNPDSVTTTFVGVISLTSFMKQEKQIAVMFLVCGLLGAMTGTLINAACYLPPSVDPANWMWLLSVPWAVLLTMYLLLFLGLDSPGGLVAGIFSALFVIIVQVCLRLFLAHISINTSFSLIIHQSIFMYPTLRED